MPSFPLRVVLAATLSLLASACASISGGERPAHSSYGCMRAVRDTVPTDIPDKRQHCLAAGGIALVCSVAEAYIAGVSKEVSDAFTGGDPDWQDLRADAFGIRCARAARTEAGLVACCAPLGTKMP